MIVGAMMSAISGGVLGLSYSIFGGFGLGHAVVSYPMGGLLAMGCFLAATLAHSAKQS